MEILSLAIEKFIKPLNKNLNLEFLIETLRQKPSSHWIIPARVCQAFGGQEEDAIETIVAVIALHSSIVLIDDLLDSDNRFEDFNVRTGDIANISSYVLATTYSNILNSNLSMEEKISILLLMNNCIGETAYGQYQDANHPLVTENDYWTIIRLKSSPYFKTLFLLGGIVGKSSDENKRNLEEIGSIYGEMIQIHDDLRDCLTVPASRDWQLGRHSLPILYAQIVDYPEKLEFKKLYPYVSDIENLQKAQKILLKSGAISYSLYCLREKHVDAKDRIQSMDLTDSSLLFGLFNQLLHPVEQYLNRFANL